jgi:hypothetical protein
LVSRGMGFETQPTPTDTEASSLLLQKMKPRSRGLLPWLSARHVVAFFAVGRDRLVSSIAYETNE